jgi:hypothetical protein
MLLNILAVGDVVGEGGQDILSRRLRDVQKEHDVHFTVVNGENCSGVGILPRQAQRLFDAGADVITLGNHTWNRIQIAQYMEKEPALLRPHNYAGKVPGQGFGIFKCRGLRIAVMNLIAIARVVPQKPKPLQNLLRPALPAVIMGVVVYGAMWLLGSLGISSRIITCCVPIAIGAVVYVVCAAVFKAITAEDCKLLPKGEKLAKLLKL